MIRSAVIILNPAGGRGRAGRRRAEVERLLASYVSSHRDSDDLSWEIVETRSSGEATEIASRAAKRGTTIVAAAGGDGTLSEVLNGVIGSNACLALLPLGTGNDFARSVGLHDNLPRAVFTLFQGQPRSIDVGVAAGRHFLNVSGCGFDAVVADRANHGPKWLSGAVAYLWAVLGELARYRAAEFTLEVDGKVRTLRAMMCSVANAQTYGGGMRIAPDAQLDDGLFDLCLLSETSKIEFILAFPRVFRGTHTTHPKIEMLRASKVRIETTPPLPLLVDGEICGTTPVEFTILPRAIQFLFPATRS